MRVPLSWLKEFVDIDVPVELLAERLTLAGLEVGGIEYIGLPQTQVEGMLIPPSGHLVWDRERILLGKIREVKQHPNADKLVLAMVEIGGGHVEQCVTGAPNLFQYKDTGELNPPLWTAFAAEGAEVWDGHSDELKRMILKEKPLRGIPNRSMVCSEKELGMSEEHEGVILMREQPADAAGKPFAPGTALADVLGDIVLDIELTPNMARAYSILGVAREVAALLGKEVRQPTFDLLQEGASIDGQVALDIRVPELNPRFTLALVRDVTIKPSPEWMQRRLRLVGQRPINNIVDITNYVMFEIGQPTHAFDYDKLKARAKGKTPTIITRLPEKGETLETLDQVKRELQDHNILVCDTEGVLSLGGVIGGAETEIAPDTKNVLYEAAAWNYINIRRTMQTQKVQTDAGLRFSRGVHPSQALLGLKRGAELMRRLANGTVAQGIVDQYPQPPAKPVIELPAAEIKRLVGVPVAIERAADILSRLGFEVTLKDELIQAVAPDHRLDIGAGVVGQADLVEEIVRVIGYDQLPDTIIADEMPPQWSNVDLLREERARDILVALGLRENISHRLTTPEREALLTPPNLPVSFPGDGYVTLANPIASDKVVMRHTLLTALLETAKANTRWTRRQQVFEIGSVYLPQQGQLLPAEPRTLAILMTGPRSAEGWRAKDGGTEGDPENVNYFDLKGVVEGLLNALHLNPDDLRYERANHSTFHPGRSAEVFYGQKPLGYLGELHPIVAQNFELTDAPVMVAEFDLDAILMASVENHRIDALPTTPPLLQDIALVVTEQTAAADVERLIWRIGGKLLRDVKLFDVYRGDPIPAGQKSLAYNLVYGAPDRTLTDKDVAKVHQSIVKVAEKELGARLRA